MNAVRPDFTDDDIAFVIANLQTSEGEAFARQHNVPNTTLVYLDAAGHPLEIQRGIPSQNELRNSIREIFELP